MIHEKFSLKRDFFDKHRIADSTTAPLRKALVFVLGAETAVVLSHLGYSQANKYRTTKDGWHQQSIEWMAYQCGLSQAAVTKAKKRLVEIGLISLGQFSSGNRTTLWKLNRDELDKFIVYATIVRLSMRPDAGRSQKKTSLLAKEYSHAISKYVGIMPRRTKPIIMTEIIEKEVMSQDAGPFCKYVEHWNAQPYVPKCRRGTKTYARCHQFFMAHRRFSVGKRPFALSLSFAKNSKLSMINAVPPDCRRRGIDKIPVRDDAQMFLHIERAALAYNPDFTCGGRRSLPNTLSSFLYNTYNKTSLFISTIYKDKPVLRADLFIEKALASLAKDEQAFVDMLVTLYNNANNRHGQALSTREMRNCIFVARAMIDARLEWKLEHPAIEQHLRGYTRFISFFVDFCGQPKNLWDGMPIAAFHPEKVLWSKFINYVNGQFGINVLTGKRI